MRKKAPKISPNLLDVIAHIGKHGASSEEFVCSKFQISLTTLYNLKASGYLDRQALDVRGRSEGIYTLRQKAKTLLAKGSYMKGEPTRNELPTLLYMQEAMERIEKSFDILEYTTERKIKGINAKKGDKTAHAPDGQLKLRTKGAINTETINIEIDGAYHGKELRDKLLALDRAEENTLWVCFRSRQRTEHVKKYAENLGVSKINVVYIGDL